MVIKYFNLYNIHNNNQVAITMIEELTIVG